MNKAPGAMGLGTLVIWYILVDEKDLFSRFKDLHATFRTV